MCELATRTSMGEKLADLGYKSGIAKRPDFMAVKVPVFSFEKLTGLDTNLGPEMKSTGEVLGIGKDFAEALFKGLVAAKHKISRTGGVFISVRNTDKPEIAEIAERFASLGFKIFATGGTAQLLTNHGLNVTTVQKIKDCAENNTATLLESGQISYIICTAEKGRDPMLDEVKIRRKACILGIPCLTSLDTAEALAHCLKQGHEDGGILLTEESTTLVDINKL